MLLTVIVQVPDAAPLYDTGIATSSALPDAENAPLVKSPPNAPEWTVTGQPIALPGQAAV